jgi:hypothetical protein
MRIRSVKPEFFRHEELQDCEASHPGKYIMLSFIGLWCISDSKGRFEWKPRVMKLDILPFLNFNMEETLAVLEEHGFVERYEVDGRPFGFIPSFEKHQRITGKEFTEGEKYPPQNRETTGKQRGNNRGSGKKTGENDPKNGETGGQMVELSTFSGSEENPTETESEILETSVNQLIAGGKQQGNNGETTRKHPVVQEREREKERKGKGGVGDDEKNTQNSLALEVVTELEKFTGGADEIFSAWRRWVDYKQGEHRERYRKPSTEAEAVRHLFELARGDTQEAAKIITQSIANTWKGFFEIKTNHNGYARNFNKTSTPPGTVAASGKTFRARAGALLD